MFKLQNFERSRGKMPTSVTILKQKHGIPNVVTSGFLVYLHFSNPIYNPLQISNMLYNLCDDSALFIICLYPQTWHFTLLHCSFWISTTWLPPGLVGLENPVSYSIFLQSHVLSAMSYSLLPLTNWTPSKIYALLHVILPSFSLSKLSPWYVVSLIFQLTNVF